MFHPYFQPSAAPNYTWSVPDLCAAYDWPTNLAGGGVIAIVELGGGWIQSDMYAYFSSIHQSQPHIVDVSVDGANNNHNPSDPASAEVTLDIQIAAASYFCATGKSAQIRVYWHRNTMDSIAACIRAAMRDSCDVCSISWGTDEANWGGIELHRMNNAATDANKRGMTVFAASGDNDSSDGGADAANVDSPASCPHVIGCGGTKKTLTDETVWNNDPGNANGHGTGGGFSEFFQRSSASWQIGAPASDWRMVPDVAANADPYTGYVIRLGGQNYVFGGTSCVAPLYAGLFAAFGTNLGFITPKLWKNPLAFNNITVGNNGYYYALPGPDPCSGLGTPIGTKLAALFVK